LVSGGSIGMATSKRVARAGGGDGAVMLGDDDALAMSSRPGALPAGGGKKGSKMRGGWPAECQGRRRSP
jgi:hypothetical protein